MTAPYLSLAQLHSSLSSLGEMNGTFTLKDTAKLRDSIIDQLVWTSVFGQDKTLQLAARDIIQALSLDLGVISSSHQKLYEAIGRSEVTGFTVPAMNIRVLVYDTCRLIFRLAKKHSVGAFVIELARSEMGYSFQDPSEFAASVLSAAIKENYHGHVFLQGDHYQVNADLFAKEPEKELENLKRLILQSLEAKLYNIDIDASTVVDLSKPTIHEQQEVNARITAQLTNFIRQHQPEQTTVSIGGEIGHIGDRNSTAEDFTSFMEQYATQIEGKGITKVSAQTGSSHGGLVGPDGKIQEATIDFSVLESIGSLAREKYQMGGVVQHGASTLPLDLYPTFVEKKTLEIHLSTQFQNIVFETMPQELLEEMRQWVFANCLDERKPEWNDTQFFYKLRKKAIGPFKQRLWELSDEQKTPILQALEKEYELIFQKLNVLNTKDIVAKYV